MANRGVVVPKVWRSELTRLGVFAVLCAASIILSRSFPQTVIYGELITIGRHRVDLGLPIFWLFPLFALLELIFRVYNVRYEVNTRFIEARTGRLSFHQRLVRIRYEDIRGVETDQSLFERFLDIGTVSVGSAATDGMEVQMEGISAPLEVQEMIQSERDKRIKLQKTMAGRSQMEAV